MSADRGAAEVSGGPERRSGAERRARAGWSPEAERGLSDALLTRAQRLGSLGTFPWDARTNRVTWSDEMYRIHGRTAAEFGGTLEAFVSCVHPDDRARVQATVERAVRDRESFHMRERIVRPDGRTRLLDSEGEVILGADGAPLGLYGICRDVTDEQYATEELRATEERFRLLVERVRDYAILMLDPDGQVISWNQGAERIKGYRADEIIGQNMSRFYTPEDVKRGLPVHLLGVAATEGRVEDEGWRVRKDGSRFWADVVITALRDETGLLRGFGKVTRDLTERRQVEIQLRELSGRFLRVQEEERRRIARELHDSTSPLLTALIAKLYTLKQRLSEVEGTSSKLLEDSLKLAESSGGVIRTVAYLLHPPLLEEHGLIASLQWYVNGFVNQTGIRVDTDFPPELQRLTEDAEIALYRVAQESLTNVLRHSGSRRAKLRVAVDLEYLTLEVIDQGRGVTAAALRSLETGAGQLGVGLPGMRERMRQLGGKIIVNSSPSGTRVTAVLPLSEHTIAPPTPSES